MHFECKSIYQTWEIWWKKQRIWEKSNLIQAKKHQDENASEASDFLCTRFQMSTKHFGTTNSHQKPIYVSPDGRKNDTNSPSRKQIQIVHKVKVLFSPKLKLDDFLV